MLARIPLVLQRPTRLLTAVLLHRPRMGCTHYCKMLPKSAVQQLQKM
jgi:hypothetical protein